MTVFQRVMVRIAALTAPVAGRAQRVYGRGRVNLVGGPYPRPEPSRPQMCTMEYNPVCGERGNNRRTFGNACQARAERFSGLPGVANAGRSGPISAATSAADLRTREYAPVCARQGRREQRRFRTAAWPKHKGFRVIGRGEMRAWRNDRPVDDSGMRPPRDPDRRPQVCTSRICAGLRPSGAARTDIPECLHGAGARGFRVIGNGGCRWFERRPRKRTAPGRGGSFCFDDDGS